MTPHANPLAADCADVLRQGLALLERLPDELYADAGGLPVASAVGGHFRHCVDFYQSFLAGAQTGGVDYNRRGRDVLIERDRRHASARIELLIDELEALPIADGRAPVLVSAEGADETGWCESTVARELQYLLGHTIHHYALVALMLRLRGFEPGAEFGVAPSTLKHWRESAPCAR